MAEVVRYINTASTAGGDGTTNATSGANRAYIDIPDFVTGEAVDLVAAGDNIQCWVDGAGNAGGRNSGQWSTDGWTMAAANDVRFEAYDVDVRAGTEFDTTGKPYIDQAHGDQGIYLEYINLQIYNNTGNPIAWYAGGASHSLYEGCMIGGDAVTTSEARYIDFQSGSNNFNELINCIIYADGTGTQTVLVSSYSSNLIMYNCTVVGKVSSHLMLMQSGHDAIHVQNNVMEVLSGGGVCFDTGEQVDWDSDETNITSDTTSSQTGLRSTTLTYASATDFALVAGDTDAIDAGTDLSADAQYAFSDDILGTTRPSGSSWDIGAYELVSAATFIHSIHKYYRQLMASLGR